MDRKLCDKLISSVFLSKKDHNFFLNNLNNEQLFLELTDLLADREYNRYSDDSKTIAANYISQFDTNIITKYEDKLLYLLNNIEGIDLIKDPIYLALSRIKSKAGLKSIVNQSYKISCFESCLSYYFPKNHNISQTKQIYGVFDRNTIRVYQAFTRAVANEVLERDFMGTHFNIDRMTWIKPSFLWMMYRCGWAEKENQEVVLAIDIKREKFDFLVSAATPSKIDFDLGLTDEEKKNLIKKSDIRCQWDPDRDIYGSPINRRAIQIGIRRGYSFKYLVEWIENVEDITSYVSELKNKLRRGENILHLLPKEEIYTPKNMQQD